MDLITLLYFEAMPRYASGVSVRIVSTLFEDLDKISQSFSL
jgi:hypothetical protein